LKTEDVATGEGFYCNRNVVTQAFLEGSGICALIDGASVGFSVFQMYDDGGDIHIVEVHPGFRGRGIGGQLLEATVERLRKLGAQYVDVECTSRGGEALCRRHGFEDYVDPNNYRNEWDDPELRRYLSDWRPPVRSPWS
jgi:ribosomal protein S18 acetylase RimI-like enzyme